MAHTSDPVVYDGARAAGVLLHPTSLPGSYGVGDLGDELTSFLDWAATAGMRIWQTLPLNPPGYGNSPYTCLSSFAGNPLFISPQRLLQDGLLPPHAVDQVPPFPDDHVEFDRVAEYKRGLLQLAWESLDDRSALDAFIGAEEQREWLDDFALFMALKERAGGGPWWTWERRLAHRDEHALSRVRHELAEEIDFHRFVQWVFFRQWAAVRAAAAARGIRVFGDVPIYVAHDSADVWSRRDLFQLDARGMPTVVAGVPPDYFSATGQRWGNPLYRWEEMREDNYAWWVSRIRANLRLADFVRLDHFRGFADYWEIPASEQTAIHGQWLPGPRRELFDAIRAALGELPVVAEDLGFITAEVHKLRQEIGVAGMKILQFGFEQIDSPHLPHRYEPKMVVYTGTHDNHTARGWFDAATDDCRRAAESYLGATEETFAAAMVRAAYTSVAQMAVVPMQDVLGLDDEARMNRPGDVEHNWAWRLRADALTREDALRLHRLAEISGRL